MGSRFGDDRADQPVHRRPRLARPPGHTKIRHRLRVNITCAAFSKLVAWLHATSGPECLSPEGHSLGTQSGRWQHRQSTVTVQGRRVRPVAFWRWRLIKWVVPYLAKAEKTPEEIRLFQGSRGRSGYTAREDSYRGAARNGTGGTIEARRGRAADSYCLNNSFWRWSCTPPHRSQVTEQPGQAETMGHGPSTTLSAGRPARRAGRLPTPAVMYKPLTIIAIMAGCRCWR